MSNYSNPNPLSPRMSFQWVFFQQYRPNVLNIGCADDPLGFGEDAHHYDIDDWSYLHKRFTQGDAAQLPFGDQSWQCIILGDILEHVVDPVKVMSEACRVCAPAGMVVATIFEEWRLPGPGQYIEEGQLRADKVSQDLGYAGRIDYQDKNYPDKVTFDDVVTPHLIHINQFTDEIIQTLADKIAGWGFEPLHLYKAFEVQHEGHNIYNWLLAFRRLDSGLGGEHLRRIDVPALFDISSGWIGLR